MNDHPLKAHLFDAYGGFADKRIKDLAKSNRFIVDDRKQGDIGADGKLYSSFCSIFARVTANDTLEVTLHGNVPTSSAVEGWAQSCGAKLAIGIESTLTVTLGLGEVGRVRELAEHIAAIVAPNAPRYSVAAYKYTCPRTAQSLQRLADICDAFVRGPR